MPDSEIVLGGLDGANPLAFLAAMGVLRILDHRARERDRQRPRLSWVNEGAWRPVIQGGASLDAIVGELVEDKPTWEKDPAFALAYTDSGELVDPASAPKCVRDLKPKPETMKAFLEELVRRVDEIQAEEPRLMLRRALDTAAAYGCEIVQDNNGNTKPTALHFTAGQQEFMKAVAELQQGVDPTDFAEALAGPWRGRSKLPNMGWDSTNARLYALRATSPSGDKKTSNAGAEWLAFVGLGAFPSFPVGTKLATTGVEGGWKDSDFCWPIWTAPATYAVTKSLLRTADLRTLSADKRRARAISVIFTANITRSDQGGYGAFSPAKVS